jgi:hypothetical protein
MIGIVCIVPSPSIHLILFNFGFVLFASPGERHGPGLPRGTNAELMWNKDAPYVVVKAAVAAREGWCPGDKVHGF